MTLTIGIEIEVESESISINEATQSLADSLWEVVPETSLRGARGWEVRTRGPHGQPFQAAVTSLRELFPVLESSSGTWRAGVHTHVGVTTLSPQQRAVALACAYAVDWSVFAKVAPERVESNFCVPLAHKHGAVIQAIRYLAGGDISSYVGYGKYSSVNINSMDRIGTFEFRHMKTPETGTTVASVRKALEAIKEFVVIAHGIVQAAEILPVHAPNKVLPTFNSLIGAPYFWSKLGLTPDPEIVMEINHALIGTKTTDIMQYSPHSLARVASRYRRKDTSSIYDYAEPALPRRRPTRNVLPPEPQAGRGGDIPVWRRIEVDSYELQLNEALPRTSSRLIGG